MITAPIQGHISGFCAVIIYGCPLSWPACPQKSGGWWNEVWIPLNTKSPDAALLCMFAASLPNCSLCAQCRLSPADREKDLHAIICMEEDMSICQHAHSASCTHACQIVSKKKKKKERNVRPSSLTRKRLEKFLSNLCAWAQLHV